jgi:hypothetical protein
MQEPANMPVDLMCQDFAMKPEGYQLVEVGCHKKKVGYAHASTVYQFQSI